MSFINALVAAAKNAGISPDELYAQANLGYEPTDLSDEDISPEDAEYADPFKGMSSQELYMRRPLD
ncbi:hypothetical protein N8979_00150 [bacterium]|nr:hypothetical protein [bacterium]